MATRRSRQLSALVIAVLSIATLAGSSGAVGAAPQADPIRLTGTIEVSAQLSAGTSSLTFRGRADIDVRIRPDPGDRLTVPMETHWTGVWDSCRWEVSGGQGELGITLRRILPSGRPMGDVIGNAPTYSTPCKDTTWNAAPTWHLEYSGELPLGKNIAIKPKFSWFDISEVAGTGVMSLSCTGCPAASPPEWKMMWGRRIAYKPAEPRPGQRMTMDGNVVLLERGGEKSYWTTIRPSGVAVKCDVYLTRGWTRLVKKVTVPGYWRGGAEGRNAADSRVGCGPWRIPGDAAGLWLGISPRVTYRGKTHMIGRPPALWTRTQLRRR